MAKRGRQSLASLTIARPIDIVTRPDAPYELTDAQAHIWRRVVEDLPADWWTPKNYDLLSQYCRHVNESNRIASLIEGLMQAGPDLEIAKYDKLLGAQEREGRAISSLATRMRLTQQSLYDKKLKLDAFTSKKPWEA